MSTIIGQGIGIPFSRVLGGIDQQAQAYYDRVIADGGIVPLGLPALSDYFKAVKAARGQSDINNCFLSQYWAGFGIKTAAGVGATAGGRACEKLYNLIGTTNDAIQTSAANQPLALVHTGENYVYNSGVTGNFFSSPDAVVNQITGDIDIIAYIKYTNNGGSQTIISKGGSSPNNTFKLIVSGTNLLATEYNISGYRSNFSTIGIGASYTGWVRMTKRASDGQIIFYTSSNPLNTNINSIVWTQLGTTVSGTAGNATIYSEPVKVGTSFTNNSQVYQGDIYRAAISNTIGGAPVVDFNPASYNRATSQTTWTSTTGEVWTLNTPATNNALKAAIVDQTMVMGNGTSYGLRAANLNINQTAFTSYTAFRKFVNTAGLQVINELGTNVVSGQGKALFINTNANQEDIWINANVGGYNSRYTSDSLSLKLATAVNNIANANEASPYLINDSARTFVANDSVANNTAAMNATGYNLLARNNAASLWANAILIGDSIVSGEDSAGVRTAMWDIYKSLMKVA